MPENTYFEITYKGPFKGVNVDMPENLLSPEFTPSMLNFTLKNAEIRTRPRQSFYIPAPQIKNNFINVIDSFIDANGITHTIITTQQGLFQLNPQWKKNPSKAWNLVGSYTVQPGPNDPVASLVFLNRYFWTNGSNNLWSWDGISSVGSPSKWTKNFIYQRNARLIDTNGNVQVALSAGKSGAVIPVWNVSLGGGTVDNQITWVNNGAPAPANGFISVAVVDAAAGITAGALFLIELNSQLIMLNTTEGTAQGGTHFPQRIRWSPSGFDNIWDTNVNIGAGYTDELDVPDEITGALTIGRNGFVFRTNGISEITSLGSATNPFEFNHLWASQRGIGNVFPFSIASYGPIGMFIAEDDVYNLSLGGFTRVGGVARDAIFKDLETRTAPPIAAIVPVVKRQYVYPVYKLAIPFGLGTKIWNYSIEDSSWQSDYKPTGIYTGKPNFVAIS